MGELRKPLRVLLTMLLAVGVMIPCSIAIAQTRTGAQPSHPSSQPGGLAGRTPGFEVASVRIARGSGLTSVSPSGAEYFTARNASLSLLVELAFGVDQHQISGQRELGSKLYDITAKPWGDRGLTYKQLRPLLQKLLKDRFHLNWHYETKSSKGYVLVIAKGGPKLHATKGGSAHSYILRTGLRGQNIPIAALAGMLVFPLRRPVVDETGLKGNYDIKVDYAPPIGTDSSPASIVMKAQQYPAADITPGSSLPSIFTAVQKDLGLKLESQKVSVRMLVIDHVDVVPTAN